MHSRPPPGSSVAVPPPAVTTTVNVSTSCPVVGEPLALVPVRVLVTTWVTVITPPPPPPPPLEEDAGAEDDAAEEGVEVGGVEGAEELIDADEELTEENGGIVDDVEDVEDVGEGDEGEALIEDEGEELGMDDPGWPEDEDGGFGVVEELVEVFDLGTGATEIDDIDGVLEPGGVVVDGSEGL